MYYDFVRVDRLGARFVLIYGDGMAFYIVDMGRCLDAGKYH